MYRRPEVRWILMLPVLLATACEFGLPAGQEPHRQFNWTDMEDQPKVKPQRADLFGTKPTGTLPTPTGAVATAENPYRFTADQAELAAIAMINPLPHSPAVIAKGKWVFENVCIVCHGPEAAGDGKVTKLFPKPPSLMRPKVREYTDGRIFHVPMRGQGSMPSYASQLAPEELWSVVHYIRDMQARLPVAAPDKRDLEGAGTGAGAGTGTGTGTVMEKGGAR
jgi:mono/diheme cytochrome c family protein